MKFRNGLGASTRVGIVAVKMILEWVAAVGAIGYSIAQVVYVGVKEFRNRRWWIKDLGSA